ncbi:hypothetical protein AGRO_3303 [Agrobacterium sp. ATCC 31749]|uniref:spike base protein, RCAP_Rcc01079 family n=1 Tax=unclassified Agrobacterium TaxID=2632611 RepID=UPI00020DBE0D|nr:MULTISPECIES: hypothetical protein [unclassified Agrobacterium]EGL63903.1 hypothetical protein AGRO_3303 [Agrobacterium sp. ATCC 31749]
MAETYEHHAAGLESPALHAFDVLPDDVIPLPSPTRAVGNAGHLCLTLLSGPTVTFQNLQEGHARIRRAPPPRESPDSTERRLSPTAA